MFAFTRSVARNMAGIAKSIKFKPANVLFSRQRSANPHYRELYEESKEKRKRYDERFQEHLKQLDKKKQEISELNAEIAKLKAEIVEIENKFKEKNLSDEKRVHYENMKNSSQNLMNANKQLLTSREGWLERFQTDFNKDVRSLFKNYAIPEPKVKNEELFLKISDDQSIDLSFVNRNKELQAAWISCLYNAEQPDKQYLMVCGQMFGAGKTAFGKQLFNFNNPHIKEIYDEMKFKSDLLTKTLPVEIDVRAFENEEIKTISHLVSCSIFVATLNQYFNIDTEAATDFWKKHKYSVLVCTEVLISLVNRPLFFHFDEVGSLLKRFTSIIDPMKLPILLQFWLSTFPSQSGGCFVYVSGKSSVVNFFRGYGHLGYYLGEVLHLRLSLFKTSDIQDILWSKSKASSIGARLKITTEEEAKHVAQWLHNVTTGVPGYVESAVSDMINQTDKANSFIHWDESHEEPMLSKLKEVPNLIPANFVKDETLSEKQKKEISSLALLANDQRILNWRNKMNGEEISDLVLFYGFYAETVDFEADTFRIQIPRVWMNANVFQKLPVNLLINPTIDQSSTLKDHVEKVLLFRSAAGETSRDFTVKTEIPFLSETFIADLPHSELESVKMTKEFQNDRNEDFEGGIEMKKRGCYLVEPVDKTSLPDLITLLPTIRENRYLLGWRIGNDATTTTTLGQSQIQEEINKFRNLIENHRYYGGVLVIVLNGKGSDEVEKLRGKVILHTEKPKTDDETCSFTMPKYVEVFIPTEDQMKQFFGEKPLKAFSADRNE